MSGNRNAIGHDSWTVRRRVGMFGAYALMAFLLGVFANNSKSVNRSAVLERTVPASVPHAAIGMRRELNGSGTSQAAAAAPRPVVRSTSPNVPTARTRRADARRIVQALFDRVMKARAAAGAGIVPEAIVNNQIGFMEGWVDALRFTSSDVMNDVGSELRDRTCEGSLGVEETIMSAYLLQWVPEVSSSETFECFFGRSQAEDVSAWLMLDAWRNSGLEPTPSIVALEAAARDQRTIRRFRMMSQGNGRSETSSRPASVSRRPP